MITTTAYPRMGATLPILAQMLAVVVCLIALVLAPPAEGEMLLAPLTAQAAARLPALALRDGTRLIGRGALPGSLVVRGRLATLGWPLLVRGIVPIASDRAGCTGAIA
jgi:hypothetical protein